jgi:NTE family protein
MTSNADLVLEGGGVKGIGLVGAVSILEEREYVFPRVAGTSAGAIVASLLAADMKATQLADLVKEIPYPRFEDKTPLDWFGVPGEVLSVALTKGIYKGDYFHQWLTDQLASVNVRTFGDLRLPPDPESTLQQDQRYRLVVMASDVSRGELIRLPWDYRRYGLDPDRQVVADAVRASMSIPFFFQPVKLKGTGAQARSTASWLVDGGMLSNFPIEVFDRTDGKPPRWPTFGVKLSAQRDANTELFRVKGTISLTRAMIGTMTNFHDQMHINDPCVIRRTMFVDTMKVKATEFDIDTATQQKLFDNGCTAATTFLDGHPPDRPPWDFGTYVAECR